MRDRDQLLDSLGRAGRRALVHLLRAAIEGVKAVEAVLDEIGRTPEDEAEFNGSRSTTRIEIE